MTTSRTGFNFLALLLGLVMGPAQAAVDAQARLIPPESQQAWIGQSVQFDIELMVTGQFAGAPVFELPDAENVVVMQVSNRPLINSRQLNSKTWVSQTHTFAAFSQRGGSVIIPPVTVRFGSRESWNATRQEHTIKTDSLVLSIKTPPGAKGLVAAANELRATESWQPGESRDIRVGDAVRRTISLEAENFPAMLLPAAAFEAPQDVSVYTTEPVITDLVDRGTIQAKRSDSASFVFERAGQYTLPAMSIRWWNPSHEEWRERKFEARTYNVKENIAFAGEADSVEQGTHKKGRVAGIAFILIGLVVLVVALVRVLRRRNNEQESEVQSEQSQFSDLCRAVRTENASVVYDKSTAWLDRVNAGDLVSATGNENGHSLQGMLEEVQSALIGVSTQWNRSLMEQCLVEIRKQLGVKKVSGEQAVLLQRLNPSAQS